MSHQPRKHFGQHFLTDTAILSQLIDAIAPQAEDCMIEIGPGLGALTDVLLVCPMLNQLIALEIDRDCVKALKNKYPPPIAEKLQLIEGDALSTDFSTLPGTKPPLRIVGNLPYNISTPLLLHLLRYENLIQDMHFMLQKEVVERITAAVGDKAYGRLSVVMQYACQVESLLDVPPAAFNPPPKVDSAVVRLVPHAASLPATDRQHFLKLVQQAFSQRRKMLRNTLSGVMQALDFTALAIDPQARAENVSVEAYVQMSNYLVANKK